MNTELIKQEAAPISMKIRKYVDMIARGAEGGTRISLYNLLGLIDNQISLEEKELIASYAQSLQRPGGSDGWISVGDGLPEELIEVIVFTQNKHQSDIHTRVTIGSYFQNQWLGTDAEPMYGVTHWQPLPSPPKQQP
jgi:hypothetical protein